MTVFGSAIEGGGKESGSGSVSGKESSLVNGLGHSLCPFLSSSAMTGGSYWFAQLNK